MGGRGGDCQSLGGYHRRVSSTSRGDGGGRRVSSINVHKLSGRIGVFVASVSETETRLQFLKLKDDCDF